MLPSLAESTRFRVLLRRIDRGEYICSVNYDDGSFAGELFISKTASLHTGVGISTEELH